MIAVLAIVALRLRRQREGIYASDRPGTLKLACFAVVHQANSAGLAWTMYSFYKSNILKKKNGRTSPDNALFLVCNNYNIIMHAILSAASA